MFKYLVTATLAIVAGTSGYISVQGLASIFGAGPHYIIILAMGIGLEAGKLLTVAHLHRKWSTISRTLICFYAVVILALTGLTSAEVLGFLSQAHEANSSEVNALTTKLDSLTAEKTTLEERIKEIQAILAEIPGNYITKRMEEREQSGLPTLQTRLLQVAEEITQTQDSLITAKLQAGPAQAVGATFDIDPSYAVLILVISLTLVLEPLSLGLVIATSAAWKAEPKKPEQPEQQVNELSETQPEEQPVMEPEAKALTVKECQLDLLKAYMISHQMDNSQIAKITGRKEQTVKKWLSGDSPLPADIFPILHKSCSNGNAGKGRKA